MKTNVCLFPSKVIQQLMVNNDSICSYVLKNMLESMDQSYVKINDLTQLSLQALIAKVLYDISEHFSSFTLKREVLASYIGGSRESISRILGELKKDEIVDLQRSTIVIKNRKALKDQFIKYA